MGSGKALRGTHGKDNTPFQWSIYIFGIIEERGVAPKRCRTLTVYEQRDSVYMDTPKRWFAAPT